MSRLYRDEVYESAIEIDELTCKLIRLEAEQLIAQILRAKAA